MLASLAHMASGQVASDYYNKPSQELYESVSQESTFVHRAGFLPCFKSVLQWARRNRDKYNLLSVTSTDSLGMVRVTSTIDCQPLFGSRRAGAITECNLILTSCTNSLKIGFADLKSKDCGALWRVSIEKELVHAISLLPDSVASPAVSATIHVVRGLGYTKGIDSIFDAIRADSIARSDSIFHAHVVDSIAALSRKDNDLDSAANAQIETRRAQTDSISAVVQKDSVDEQKRAATIFEGQPVLKGKNVTTEAKLDCLVFFLSNRLRTKEQVKAYLQSLEKLCSDEMCLYFTARNVVSPDQKYLCMLYYKKMQSDYGKVQAMLLKMEPAGIVKPSPVENVRME